MGFYLLLRRDYISSWRDYWNYKFVKKKKLESVDWLTNASIFEFLLDPKNKFFLPGLSGSSYAEFCKC
jgi:hypothetical protein